MPAGDADGDGDKTTGDATGDATGDVAGTFALAPVLPHAVAKMTAADRMLKKAVFCDMT
jgi:hypothetical protein